MRCEITKVRKHSIIHDQVGQKGGQIDGVVVKKLVSWPDDRGHFAEIFRDEEDVARGFAVRQTSITMTRPGTIKAFHYHLEQSDIFVPVAGHIRIALVDFRAESPTFGLANSIFCGHLYLKAVRIPKGVAHGYEVLGGEDMTMVYYTDCHYNPKDEYRARFDDPAIGWTWWGVENR
jgi:dTDP-4-dehydrorhamnose 3,5-epimerase